VKYDVVIVGAGPYGLSAAAYLREIGGISVHVFGEPMQFWRCGMPSGMLLRSAWSASHIADPTGALSLDAYKIVSGNHLAAPISLERFVQYGLWYQRSAVPDVDTRKVKSVTSADEGFHVTVEDGEELSAARVIVAAGISSFANRPSEFSRLPAGLVSHTSQQRDLSQFAGKRVVVVGAGQSALESAALLHERGCQVQVIARRPVHWLGWKERLQPFGPASRLLFSSSDVGPAGVSRVVSAPDLLRKLPRTLQHALHTASTRPAGARWLMERLRNVPIKRTAVRNAVLEKGAIRLELANGQSISADHVLLGTGYKVDVSRYKFLDPRLLESLQVENGSPRLGRGFESCVAGLHFLGAPAASSYGPMMYFVSGTKYTGETLREYLSHRNKRP